MVSKPFTVNRICLIVALIFAVFALLAATGAFALFGWGRDVWLCWVLVAWLAAQVA